MPFRRSSGKAAVCIVLLAAAPFACDDDARPTPTLTLPAIDTIVAIEIELLDEHRRVNSTSQTTDPAVIAKIMQVVAGTSPVKPHKCAHVGRLIIHRRGEKAIDLQLLPGHDERVSEIRQGDAYYTVSRKEFSEALRTDGLAGLPAGSP